MKSDKLKKNSEEYFDRVTESDYVIPEPTRCYEVIMDRLKDKDELGTVADVGCGTGEMLVLMADKWGDKADLIGIDLSSGALHVAGQKLEGRAKLIKADVDDMPLDDCSVDMILNMHSFHHYPEPSNALREMYRVLRNGGRYYLVENEYGSWRRTIGNIRLALNRHSEGDIKMYKREELFDLVTAAGFEIESAEAIAEHSNLIICRK